MKAFAALGLLILLGGCALPQTVQRIGVEYNTAVAGMADELALLNIVRAKSGMPLHYTSVSRLSGSVTLKATSGLNEAIKFAAPTVTNSSVSTAPGGSTVPTTVATTATTAVTSGGNVLTPTVGGEVDTGPSFDIAILDSKNFYNGILAPVPATTIANFSAQGYDPNVLLGLFAQRIDFKLKDNVDGVLATNGALAKKGDVVLSVSDTDKGGRTAFMDTVKCFTLVTTSTDGSMAQVLLPVSRITTDKDGKRLPFALKDVASLDGVSLGLSAPITKDPDNDANINIVRPSKEAQFVHIESNGTCVHPDKPPSSVIFTDHNKVMVAAKGKDRILRNVDVDPQVSIIFRSTEGAIRFLGDCLDEAKPKDGQRKCIIKDVELFSLGEGDGAAAVTTQLLGKSYYIAADDRTSLRTLGLIEQLISLEQSETDKPVTVPIQVIP